MDTLGKAVHAGQRSALVLATAIALALSGIGVSAGAQTSEPFNIGPIEVAEGDVLISDTGFSPAGQGEPDNGMLWVYDPDTAALFEHPLPFGGTWDIQWFSNDSILIANATASRIWLLDLPSGQLELIAEGEPLVFPIGLALDPTDDQVLWIADHAAGILLLNMVSGALDLVVGPFAGQMDGIVVADDGTVFFTNQSGTVYRVASELPGGYEPAFDLGPYSLNGLVFDDAGALLATATFPPGVAEIDTASGTFTVYEYSHVSMQASEDTAVGTDGSWWVIDSAGALYRIEAPRNDAVALLRGEPIGDTVDLLIVPPQALDVAIDIKPGAYPNSVNINGHGVIPVAVLGSEDFDVTEIDDATLDFAGLEVKTNPRGNVQCSFEDVSGDFTYSEGAPDGYLDLVCQFLDDLEKWSPEDSTAALTGTLLAEYGGTAFVGSDSFRLVPVR